MSVETYWRRFRKPSSVWKDIYEQPSVISETMTRLLNEDDRIFFETLSPKVERRLRAVKKVFMVSCGTAFHAGLVGSLMIKDYAGIPTEAQFSSEFRYQNP